MVQSSKGALSSSAIWSAISFAGAVAPSGGGTGPGRIRSRRPQSRGGGRQFGPFAGWGSSGERGAVGPSTSGPPVREGSCHVPATSRPVRPSSLVRAGRPARPSVLSVNRQAAGLSWGTNRARSTPRLRGGGAAGVLTQMARSLTLARWGTDNANGTPTDLGSLGY